MIIKIKKYNDDSYSQNRLTTSLLLLCAFHVGIMCCSLFKINDAYELLIRNLYSYCIIITIIYKHNILYLKR